MYAISYTVIGGDKIICTVNFVYRDFFAGFHIRLCLQHITCFVGFKLFQQFCYLFGLIFRFLGCCQKFFIIYNLWICDCFYFFIKDVIYINLVAIDAHFQ